MRKRVNRFQKKRKNTLKKLKKQKKFFLNHPLVIPTVSFLTLFFIGIGFIIFLGASTQGAADARIVNVYADGEQQTVTTRAKNVGDLLQRLEINLIEEDIVEPAVDSPILEDDTQVNIYRARPVRW